MKGHEAKHHKSKQSDIKCRTGADCLWAKRNRCRVAHENVANTKECRDGETCRFKAQGRCSYCHKDVGVQKVRQPRSNEQSCTPSAPNSQWQTMQPRWKPQENRPSVWQMNQQPNHVQPSSEQQTQAWCPHGVSCNLGRYCVLRHFSDQDFRQL